MKSLTLEEYQKAGEEFFPKYFYVAKELGEGAKPEEILKVLEALAVVAMKQRIGREIRGILLSVGFFSESSREKLNFR